MEGEGEFSRLSGVSYQSTQKVRGLQIDQMERAPYDRPRAKSMDPVSSSSRKPDPRWTRNPSHVSFVDTPSDSNTVSPRSGEKFRPRTGSLDMVINTLRKASGASQGTSGLEYIVWPWAKTDSNKTMSQDSILRTGGNNSMLQRALPPLGRQLMPMSQSHQSMEEVWKQFPRDTNNALCDDNREGNMYRKSCLSSGTFEGVPERNHSMATSDGTGVSSHGGTPWVLAHKQMEDSFQNNTGLTYIAGGEDPTKHFTVEKSVRSQLMRKKRQRSKRMSQLPTSPLTPWLMFQRPEDERAFQCLRLESCRNRCRLFGGYMAAYQLLVFFYIEPQYGPSRLMGEQRIWVWEYLRLFNAMLYIMISLLCHKFVHRSRLIKSMLKNHWQTLWCIMGAFPLFSELLFLALIELTRECAPDCSNTNMWEIVCPSAFWALTPVLMRTYSLVAVNLIIAIKFSTALLINLVYLLLLLPTLVPWGTGLNPLTGESFTRNDVKLSMGIGLIHLLVIQWTSLSTAYAYEKVKRQEFAESTNLRLCKTLTRTMLSTMLPERFHDLLPVDMTETEFECNIDEAADFTVNKSHPSNHSQTSYAELQFSDCSMKMPSSDPGLVLEEYPHVTLVFCSFDKTDMEHIVDPSAFLRLVSDCVGIFDQIVDEHGLCKVEHVGQDYVVASPVLKKGPGSVLHTQDNHERTAADLLLLAQQLVSMGNSIHDIDCNRLHFKAGVHSGPIIGGIAGRNRRFYRVFGDTVNTAARMCHHAPPNSVHLSHETMLLVENYPYVSLIPQPGPIDIKGKGLMQTYTLAPDMVQSTSGILTLGTILEPKYDHVVRPRYTGLSFKTNSSNSRSHGHAFRHSNSNSRNGPVVSPPDISICDNFLDIRKDSTYLQLQHKIRVYSPFRGMFRNPRMEAEFRRATESHVYLQTELFLLVLTLVHMAFYGSLLLTNHNQPSNLQFSGPIGTVMTMSSVFCLWVLRRARIVHKYLGARKVVLIFALCVSTIGFLLLLHWTTCRFSILFLSTIVSIRPALEMSHIYMMQMILVISLTIVVAELSDLITQRYLFVVFLPIFLTIPAFAYHQSIEMRRRRIMWQLSSQLRKKHEDLCTVLYDLMPSSMARKFILSRQMMRSRSKDSLWTQEESAKAVILTYDLVNFTPLSQSLTPWQVMRLLHRLWCITDLEVERACYQTKSRDEEEDNDRPLPFKMDTIGDAYIVVQLLSKSREDYQRNAIKDTLSLASKIAHAVRNFSINEVPSLLNIEPGLVTMRMGCACDDVVAGVIGFIQPRYHVYGKALNKAFELESQSEPGHVLVCDRSVELLSDQVSSNPLISLLKVDLP